MNNRPVPEWFKMTDRATSETMKRIADSVQEPNLPIQVKFLPIQAHWFILDSLSLANQANREGMHANALALTRQCLEAISVVELGLSTHPDAAHVLLKWDRDKISPGELRRWLSANVWPSYGSGIWTESWSDYMAHLTRAIQPYAHYTSHLAQWQAHLLGQPDPSEPETMYVRFAPRAYDPQKATRITLFHAILTYTLGRIWVVGRNDPEFSAMINRLGKALGKSKYLDGHETNWEQQFWGGLSRCPRCHHI
ncbi:hypothetical protein VSX64_23225 [Aurantimonas sp. C2-6-R+9]|uniref:hypothetical protein n=1 Tax=unclassified Aurantimonas TaxID=2638230 RepID=UPI002E172558|nr:hypothetical protein [Aurantimonas sp. C2-6-R+9]